MGLPVFEQNATEMGQDCLFLSRMGQKAGRNWLFWAEWENKKSDIYTMKWVKICPI